MSFILIIGTFEALFLVLLLISKKNKSRSDTYLGLIFLIYAVTLVSAYLELYNFENNYTLPLFLNINWLTLLLHGPALWFYIMSLTRPYFRVKPLYFLHFLPFVVFGVAYYFHFWYLPVDEKIFIMKNELFKDQVFYKIVVMSIGVSTIGYNLWALNLIRDYRRNLKNYLAKIHHVDLKWLWILCVASISIYIINSGLFNLDLIFHFAGYQLLMLVTYSFASVYILVLGYFGLQQENVFTQKNIDNDVFKRLEDPKKPDKPQNPDAINQLLTHMETEKPYLDPELSILKLSSQLTLKTETVSTALNNHLGQNFFDFINKYRIDEFKIQALLDENKHLSIMGLAYDCGFNSKAAFYRAFKKFEGISPSAYIQSVSQKSETP